MNIVLEISVDGVFIWFLFVPSDRKITALTNR